MTALDIIKKYLGTKYLHCGRDMNEGLDCYGLIICIYKDLGYELIDFENYPEEWHLKGADYFAENYSTQWHPVDKPELYDVVLFESANGIANHAGVYLGNNEVLHAIKAGVCKTKINLVNKKIVGFYRLKK